MNRELGYYLNVVGVDDGYFPPSYKDLRLDTVLAAVLCCNNLPIDVRLTRVKVDYDYIEGKIVKLVVDWMPQVDLIILDGVTYAGFNVVDPDELSYELNIPVITFFHYELNLKSIEEALLKHFPDGRKRLKIIRKVYLRSKQVPTPWRPIRLDVVNISFSKVVDIITKLQITSPIPEPLRIADLVASGISKRTGLLNLINKMML